MRKRKRDSCDAHSHLYRKSTVPATLAIPSEVCLDKPALIIGRDQANCDIWLDSKKKQKMISRSHAKLTYKQGTTSASFAGGQWSITDLNSMNGLFVNHVRTLQSELSDHDLLVFGDGASVEVGATREQLKSEFAYVFRAAVVDDAEERDAKRMKAEERVAQLRQEEEERRKQREVEEEKLVQARKKAEEMQAMVEEQQKELDAERAKMAALVAEEEKKTAEDRIAVQRETEAMQAKQKELEDALAKVAALAAEEEKKAEDRKAVQRETEAMQAKQKELEDALAKVAALAAEEEKKTAEERKAMQEERERLQKQMEELENSKNDEITRLKEQTSSKPNSDLEEHVMCVICCDFMVFATTVNCSHSFCEDCLLRWSVNDNTCPTCRKPIQSQARALTLDNIIDNIVENGDDAAKEAFKERVAKKTAENKQKYDLEREVEKEKKRGGTYLDIKKSWAQHERDLVHKGSRKQQGTARVAYYTLVGLTPALVRSASISLLRTICANLCLTSGGDITAIRKRILSEMYAFS